MRSLVLISFFLSGGWAHALKSEFQAIANGGAPFVSHAAAGPMHRYLGMNIPVAPVARLRQRVEEKLGHHLRNRGEAHITVITPPEYEHALKEHLDMAKIDRLALAARIQSTKVTPICVGMGQARIKGRLEKTYFLVVRAPGLLKIRRRIWRAFLKRGGSAKAFHPSPYYPHITLGFTARDLYGSDGVIKDIKSCRLFGKLN